MLIYTNIADNDAWYVFYVLQIDVALRLGFCVDFYLDKHYPR